MEAIDIVLDTTYATTSPISLPAGMALIGYAETGTTSVHYLQGAGVIANMQVTDYGADHIHINRQAVKHNIVKLRYRAVGTLVRTH